jgi:2-keto-4-pentenoate hydratase/2-oxohepta-3-ene-1,7-dioic acid hydratase in catechol pathway
VDIAAQPPFVLGRFSTGDEPSWTGVVLGDRVVPLRATPAGTDSPFDDWQRVVAELTAWSRTPDLTQARSLRYLRLHAPIVPGQVFQSGANYRSHLVELVVAQQIDQHPGEDVETLRARAARGMDERAAHGEPYVFIGLPSSISGPHDDIVLPNRGTQHDWELELGVVIGKPARNVRREHALEYVAGYTIVNDVTTRDLVFRPDIPGIGTDWLAGKNARTFSPTGPFLVPAAFVDPTDLRIELRLNGELMQDGKTSDMVFDVPRLIEHVSAITELRPGDLLMTGSPAGNGAHYGRYLRPGDVLDGEITGLGRQRTQCVAP